MNEVTWRVVGLAGLVVAIVSIWLDQIDGGIKYWDDGTQGVLLLAVAIVAGLLLAVSWMQRRAAPARVATALCFFLVGYFLWIVALAAFGNWDNLGIGAWLGLVGALVGLIGSWLGSTSQGTEPSMTSAMGAQGVQMGLVAALGGVALCAVSIWLDASEGQSYWNAGEDKMLGIVMLVACGITGLAVLAAWMGRGQSAALWASLLAMLTLGLYAVLPVGLAFNQLGEIEIGGWLGLIGGLVAAVGTELAHMASARTAHVATPAPAV